jgi:hypothetical protein
MPRKTSRKRAPQPPTAPAAEERSAPREASPRASSAAPGAPLEQGFTLWTQFAKETGDTISEYLRRFGEEQQKNYESWLTSVADASRPTSRDREMQDAQNRLEEWNRRAEEIGGQVRDAFVHALEPQKDLFESWVRPFLPKEASADEKAREATEIVQKLWTGLTTSLARRLFDSLQPGKGVEDLVKVQEDSLKEFTDSFQKLTQIYFTSPAFVTMFGKTLDASLDLQKSMKDQDDVFSRFTGLPSRREIHELNQAVRDLSEKVGRLNSGRN